MSPDAAPACPNCGRPVAVQSPPVDPKKKHSSTGAGCLIALLVVLALWGIGKFMGGGSSQTHTSTDNSSTGATESPGVSGPQLECLGYRWHIESGFAILEGRVKNITSQSMKNVTAVASFYDGSNGFITSSDAIIDYNPILPGQVSPFRVMQTENPAMKKAGIEFKYLMGGTIQFKEAENRKTHNK